MHRKVVIPILIFLIPFCVYCQQTVATKSNFKFKNISVADGLSNTSVSSICQDHNGFIWIGTRDGLNRYDGLTFEIFREDLSKDSGISHNWIRDLLVDEDGDLWIGTLNGLNQYNERSGFTRYFHEQGDTIGLTDNSIYGLEIDQEGNIWIGTNNGLNFLNKQTKEIQRFYHDPQNASGPSGNAIKAVYEDAEQYLWLVTSNGIDRFNRKKGTFKYYSFNNQTLNSATTSELADITEDSEGNLWVGLSDGLWLYDKAADQFKKYQASATHDFQSIDDRVRVIVEDENHNLWVGTYQGLYLVNLKEDRFLHFKHDKLNPYSIKENSIYAIFEDQAANIWLGSWWGGLDYLDRNFDNFLHYNEATGLSFSTVSSFAEDAIGNFWIGTEGGGLNYFDRQANAFKVTRHDPANPRSLSLNNVQDIALYQEDKLLVATHGKGIDVANAINSTLAFQHFRHLPNDTTSISSDWLTTLMVDSRDNIWIGTIDGGLNRFMLDSGTFVRYTESGNKKNRVNAIYEDSNRNIWVGTDAGLGLVKEQKQEIDFEVAKGLNEQISKEIFCIYQDKEANFWLGTGGDGLVFSNQDFSSVLKFHEAEGLPNNVVYGILADQQQNLWLSTNNGLSKFNPNTHGFENYDVSDGLQSNEFNIDAYSQSSKGELLFGGVNGFNIFYPENARKNTYHPPVIITYLESKDQRIPLLTYAQNDPPKVEIRYSQLPFSLEFVALNYAQPGKNKLAYRLVGETEDWIEIGNNRSQTFTKLWPGKYVFELKAANNLGEWHDEFASVTIRVLPPWWQTWWAYTLYTLLALSLIWVVQHYVRIRVEDKKALERERQEREKIESINKLKLQFFTNVSHELRTPLTLIYGPLETLKNSQGQWNLEQQQALQLIDNNTKRLLRHVNSILDFRKEEVGLLKLKAAKGNFVKFVREVTLSFQELAKKRNIYYAFHPDQEVIPVYFDRDKMEVILFNLLSNAFKYIADGGQVTIRLNSLQTPSGYIHLAIEDNGIGIDPKYKEFIFEPYFQIEENTSPDLNMPNSTGIGLALTKRLVNLHRGEIELNDLKGAGTCFTIKLRTGKNHLAEDEIIPNFKSSEEIAGYLLPGSSISDSLETVKTLNQSTNKEKRPKILLVEDNPEVRLFIKSNLVQEYSIQEACDGEEGFEKAVQLMPDLIISDVMMPKMDGINLCSKLKTELRTSHIPVILLTARTSLIFEKSGLETGADDYLTKPFTPSLLLLRIRNQLASRKRQHQYFRRNFASKPKEITITTQDDQFLSRAVECVEQNLSNDNFDAELFAKEMNCGKSTLYQKLKGLTGQSTSEFTRTIRIKRAAQILKQDQSSISQVAYTVGFKDLKYFRKCFRKQFDLSPSQFIAAQQKNDFKSKNELL